MQNKKLRVGGMTIEATETYSGTVVLQLLETSFENGRRRGLGDRSEEFSRGYAAGRVDGYDEAGRTLKNFGKCSAMFSNKKKKLSDQLSFFFM